MAGVRDPCRAAAGEASFEEYELSAPHEEEVRSLIEEAARPEC